MDLIRIGKFIVEKRKELGITQAQLAKELNVTDKAVSKWERGVSFPDVSILNMLTNVLMCSMTELLMGEKRNKNSSNRESDCFVEDGTDKVLDDFNICFKFDSDRYVPPLLFGNNLEHTRNSVHFGVSAQMLQNRKFAGKPECRKGCAHEWYPIGEKAYFMFDEPYTRHAENYHMNRVLECNSQRISTFSDELAGFGQSGLTLDENEVYDFSIVVKTTKDVSLKVAFLNEKREEIFSEFIDVVASDDFAEKSIQLKNEKYCKNASLTITFDVMCSVVIGAVSLMPADNFRGMRKDVIEAMKEMGITILRWPGGNFAGEYNWQDGLLPCNMRAPLQSYLWIETQPHTMGYDFHEINVDDFVALCKEIGAEPFITINPVWNTPEESAQFVEYCNGDETTEYGKLRIERGFEKPYNVKFWSLGNEFGYGHMEGHNTPYDYLKMVTKHAEAMLERCENLIFCSSGLYPNQDWAMHSANGLSKVAPLVSLHYYAPYPKFDKPENYKEEYQTFINCVDEAKRRAELMRKQLNNDALRISFDEWNAWNAWYRPESVSDGIYAMNLLHMIITEAESLGIGLACHFEAVNEGAMHVGSKTTTLTPMGQAISMVAKHANGKVLYAGRNAVATEKDGIVTVTIVNSSYDEDITCKFDICGEIITSKIYSSESILPYSVFETNDITMENDGEKYILTMPPHSIAFIQFKL